MQAIKNITRKKSTVVIRETRDVETQTPKQTPAQLVINLQVKEEDYNSIYSILDEYSFST